MRERLDGRDVLAIGTGPGSAIGVWRMRALLEPGAYRMSAMIKSSNLVQRASNATGAAIWTYKMYSAPKATSAEGAWKRIEHPFTVRRGEEEVEFLCELAAPDAHAWFDLGSLSVTKE
jgi:hypothetical protein